METFTDTDYANLAIGLSQRIAICEQQIEKIQKAYPPDPERRGAISYWEDEKRAAQQTLEKLDRIHRSTK